MTLNLFGKNSSHAWLMSSKASWDSGDEVHIHDLAMSYCFESDIFHMKVFFHLVTLVAIYAGSLCSCNTVSCHFLRPAWSTYSLHFNYNSPWRLRLSICQLSGLCYAKSEPETKKLKFAQWGTCRNCWRHTNRGAFKYISMLLRRFLWCGSRPREIRVCVKWATSSRWNKVDVSAWTSCKIPKILNEVTMLCQPLLSRLFLKPFR